MKRNQIPKQKTPRKRGSRIASRSKKMELKYVGRRKFVKRILAARPYCEACPVFAAHDKKKLYHRSVSQDVHEIVRRSQGGSILDEKNVLAVCRGCHNRIGREPALAFDLGLAKRGSEK
jgi:5-methylcytosine-specific restriction endonuclease McrA